MKLSALLPKTNTPQLLSAILLISVIFLAFSGFQIYVAITHGQIFNVLLGIFIFITSIYLWQLKLWAQKCAKFIISLLILLTLTGIFNPFYAMDYEAFHHQLPNWWLLLAYIAPFIIIGLICFWVLDKYKNQFH